MKEEYFLLVEKRISGQGNGHKTEFPYSVQNLNYLLCIAYAHIYSHNVYSQKKGLHIGLERPRVLRVKDKLTSKDKFASVIVCYTYC